MWLRILVLLGLLGLCAAPLPAAAAASIAYARDGQAYGWCAGYGSGYADSCAVRQCQKSGGNSCEAALDCGSGYGAVAFAQDPAQVFAATCGMKNEYFARTQALAACVAAARTLCWTDSTFDPNGNDASSSDNQAFDMAFYTQLLLQLRHYSVTDADGETGPETRSAVEAFQKAIGLDPTGQPDDALLDRLLDAVGGAQQLADSFQSDILNQRKSWADALTYVDAPSPLPKQSFTQTLMQRSETDRQLALATILDDRRQACTPPAKSATPIPDASSGIWDVVCDEGEYTVMLNDDGSTVITTGGATVENESDHNGQQPSTDDGESGSPDGSHHGSAGQTTSGSRSVGQTTDESSSGRDAPSDGSAPADGSANSPAAATPPAQ